MRGAPRPKALCVFCERTITLTASGHPVAHKYKRRGVYGRTLCDGVRYQAQPCPTCRRARTFKGHICEACKSTGRIVK